MISARSLVGKVSCSIVVAATLAQIASAQQGDGTQVSIQANVFKPIKVEATPARVSELKVPPGFRVSVFADGLKNARILAMGPAGEIYVSRRDQGDVLLLKDDDKDGKADRLPTVVANRAGAHGIAVSGKQLYLATVKEVFVADIRPDGRLGPLRMIIGDLPDAGQHPNRTLRAGPDGMLYISAGSTCNACNETNPENATILRASPDGKSRTIFASGLRNTIGFDWHPATGELWGLDHGIDFLGDESQPEELNKIERGREYGWPHVHGSGGITPWTNPPGEITKEQWRSLSTPMAAGYMAHAAPMQMQFYSATAFPEEYRGDAFATMRGSWNRANPSGYEVVRVRFENGQPKAMEPFLTGFLTDGGKAHFARPVGLAMTADGALLVADDANGVIYRVAYGERPASAAAPAKAPATAMTKQMAAGSQVPLASVRFNSTASSMKLTSPSFEDGARMPLRHSEYADGVSPALEWSRVDAAKSYVLIMEDPDARPITPFVHWVAWNIPPHVTRLPEGLQEQPRLTDPEGLLQGRTSRGSVGYFGPRPPVGDPPHRYAFQIFALDVLLDLPPGADRDQVLAQMQGHVVGAGRVTGRFSQAQKPLK